MKSRVAARPYPFPFEGDAADGRTALLLLGFQRAQIDELGAPARAARDRAAALALRLGVPVLAGQRAVRDPADLPPVVRARNDARSEDRILARDDPGAAPAIEAGPRATPFRHPADNAFLASDLAHLLAVAGATRLLIAGLRTEGSVHATMREANDRGFECLLVADASAGTDAEMHATILSLTTFGHGLFGTVATSAALLEAAEAGA